MKVAICVSVAGLGLCLMMHVMIAPGDQPILALVAGLCFGGGLTTAILERQ